MSDRLAEKFVIGLGFKADTAALDETLAKMRELAALADSLERLKAFGVNVSVTIDPESDCRAIFVPVNAET